MNHAGDDRPAEKKSERSGWFLAGAAGIVLAWIFFQVGGLTGHVLSATRFILGDPGSYLYAIGRWQAGEALYRDFAWQYGPLALGWYRAFAAVGGNTPLTLVLASAATFAVAWLLTARLVVRGAGLVGGGLLAGLGLLPIMSASGAFTLNGPHGAIEMLLFAGIAWTLAAGTVRPWRLGCLAGLLQWVRFGPHAAALAAILLILAWQLGRRGMGWRDFARQLGACAGRLFAGYGLVVLPLAIWYLAAMSRPVAWAQWWPVHMVAHYAATYPNRWPQIASGWDFGTVWLPALIGLGLAVARLAARSGWSGAPGPARTGAGAGLLFFPVYYLVGCAVLFRNDNPMIGHLWLVWPGLGLAAGLESRRWRWVVVALVAPAVIATMADQGRLVHEEQAWRARPLRLPNGQQLWFHADEAPRFQALQAALGPDLEKRHGAVLLAGGGIHHFFGLQRMGRHWWFLPEFVRPTEEAEVLTAFLRCDLILVGDRGQLAGLQPPGSGAVVLWLPLPGAVIQGLRPHLREPVFLDGVGTLLRVQP